MLFVLRFCLQLAFMHFVTRDLNLATLYCLYELKQHNMQIKGCHIIRSSLKCMKFELYLLFREEDEENILELLRKRKEKLLNNKPG